MIKEKSLDLFELQQLQKLIHWHFLQEGGMTERIQRANVCELAPQNGCLNPSVCLILMLPTTQIPQNTYATQTTSWGVLGGGASVSLFPALSSSAAITAFGPQDT